MSDSTPSDNSTPETVAESPLPPPETDAVSTNSAGVRIHNLNLLAGGRPLLQQTSAVVPRNRITLLLGCSGVGKSLLLRIIAGLQNSEPGAVEFNGEVLITGREGEALEPSEGNAAVVFQHYALLDELTPFDNVRIAADHSHQSRTAEERKTLVAALLDQLGVPVDRPAGVLSGGQKQRLAIARAMATDAPVVLYDEPTSGLDTRTARSVAELLLQTHRNDPRTTLIVTHDFESLASVADQILILDHQQKAIRPLTDEERALPELALGDPPRQNQESLTAVPLLKRCLSGAETAVARLGEFTEQAALLPVSLLPLWRNAAWGMRMTGHYLLLVTGPSACLYIAVAGMIIGFVAQDFIFRYLPFRQFTEPLLMENLLHGTGFSLFRFLVPILSTILIAARSGAAAAADVGSKKYGSQLDAMRTFGMNPHRSVRTPLLWAFLIGTPFLTLLSYSVAALTSSVAFLATHAEFGIAFWDSHFHRELRVPDSAFYKGTGWLVAKLLSCAAGIGLISWTCGAAPKESATEISRGVTRAILWGTLWVLLVHFVFSLLEFKAPT